MPDDLDAFLTLISCLGGKGANIVPPADAADTRNGATHIPPEVTDARRNGKIINFIRQGSRVEWYWQMPDGEKIYHGEE
jgi:hypothetical protein